MVDVGKFHPGPVDLSTGASLPGITEVQRLTLKPGDRLVIRTDAKLSDQAAVHLLERVRVRLGLPGDVRVVILDSGMSIEVVEAGG